jgi:hypothetical protein
MSNPIPYDISYVGLYYALTGLGGYIMEEGVKTITMIPTNQIIQYDVTNSVQIKFDVRTFNQKIGLYKDANNINIISSAFDISNNVFPTDTITITSPDFVNGVFAENIISVGKLWTLYSDFIYYVNEYFSYANGFSALFTLSSQVELNNGVFDAEEFVKIINGQTLNPNTGQYISDLSGSVTISYINQLLTYVVYGNPFNNRPPNGKNGNPFTLQDGFIEGDLIFIPNGITVTLNLDIVNNNILLNNLGDIHLADLNRETNYTDGYFSCNTITTETNITRIVKAPLFLILSNLS